MKQTINSYRELLNEADLSIVYCPVKPILMDSADVNGLTHNNYGEVKVFDTTLNDFTKKSVCIPNSYYFPVQSSEAIDFKDRDGVVHNFKPYEIILVSNGNSSQGNNWHFTRIDDILDLDNNFEKVDYSRYEIEKDDINSLRKTKVDNFKVSIESDYKKHALKLKEDSSISLKMPSFKTNKPT